MWRRFSRTSDLGEFARPTAHGAGTYPGAYDGTADPSGAAIVGNPDQVVAKLERYMEMGIRSFILSGYPHEQECRYFAQYVLPRIPSLSLPHALGRVPTAPPNSPLACGPRT